MNFFAFFDKNCVFFCVFKVLSGMVVYMIGYCIKMQNTGYFWGYTGVLHGCGKFLILKIVFKAVF